MKWKNKPSEETLRKAAEIFAEMQQFVAKPQKSYKLTSYTYNATFAEGGGINNDGVLEEGIIGYISASNILDVVEQVKQLFRPEYQKDLGIYGVVYHSYLYDDERFIGTHILMYDFLLDEPELDEAEVEYDLLFDKNFNIVDSIDSPDFDKLIVTGYRIEELPDAI